MPDIPVAVTSRFMREVNTTAVLAHLREVERASVSGLAAATGLSRQAVARVLDELDSIGLVQTLPPERTGGRSGRPAQSVRFRAEAGYVVGALIDPQELHLAVADLRGGIVTDTRLPLGGRAQDQHVLDLLVAETAALLDRAGLAADQVFSATIGTPGIVDPGAGVISTVPSMPVLTGDVLVKALGGLLTCPVHLDNDLKLAARGEQWKGSETGVRHLVVVHWGVRVGAAVVIDGALYRGASNDAGELGFLDVLGGDVTPEPGLGRFETWSGVRALVRLVAEEVDARGDRPGADLLRGMGETAFETVLDGITAGSEAHLAALRRLTRRFAHGLLTIRALLDPEVVVLSGPLARVGPPLLELLHEALSDRALAPPRLELSVLGRDAVVHGALRRGLDQVESSGYIARERRSRPGIG
ncbi:ROK family transcriptional regulator [Ruania albidiflava]|uniref:ROK family transcriptional regulator n=1 Tax=Ruania albidiflava TaxID=366586 RepID=UPI0023F0911D|nr:ROK family protein [Ruania albidiflava]